MMKSMWWREQGFLTICIDNNNQNFYIAHIPWYGTLLKAHLGLLLFRSPRKSIGFQGAELTKYSHELNQ
jgi:hypothetical protein